MYFVSVIEEHNIRQITELILLFVQIPVEPAADQCAVTEVGPTAANVDLVSCKPSTSRDPRQWAQRRRPKVHRPVSTQREEATKKIAALADYKRQYYDEKMEMKRREHEMKRREHDMQMTVLRLQEQLYSEQLNKFQAEQ
jgi:hypothetical protein